jgi:hypothetical protein
VLLVDAFKQLLMHAQVIRNPLEQFAVIHWPTQVIADFASDRRAVGAGLTTESNGPRRRDRPVGSLVVSVSL